MKNALEEVTAKNAKKKSITRVKDGRGGRHAPGQREGGEGHTSYDSLPKGACTGSRSEFICKQSGIHFERPRYLRECAHEIRIICKSFET